MGKNILLIEDDQELGAQVVEALHKSGFRPIWWRDGGKILEGTIPDVAVLVLDLMLPGTHGFDVLKCLRKTSDVPVLVLSARNGTEDKVRALQLGADDYMTKPFWPEEFVERVKARIRRPVLAHSDMVTAGPLRLDLQGRQVWLDERLLDLTRVEVDLLVALARRPGAAVTRERLADLVLDPERGGTPRTLDVHMARLRKKLGRPDLVETVWGIGYRLATREATSGAAEAGG